MPSLRVLIIDDEPLARDTLKLLLEPRADVDLIGECVNGAEAVQAIRAQQPDLVFLDIQMPEKNGFEVIQEIGPGNMPLVVFVTAYDQYALRAFEVNAIDYLLKPFDDDRFEQALDRAITQLQQKQTAPFSTKLLTLLETLELGIDATPEPAPTYLTRLMVKARSAVYFVHVSDIDWIEAAGDYVSLHTGKKSHLLRKTMRELEASLDPDQFIRIHRSSILNMDRIKDVRPYFHGDYIVRLKDGQELKLSRRYWSLLESRFGK